jgi:hypothetical protein
MAGFFWAKFADNSQFHGQARTAGTYHDEVML